MPQVRRSEPDRFIADPSGHEQEVSAEVYLIVTDEGGRAVLIWWRFLAFAVAMVATGAVILVTGLRYGTGRRGSSSSAVASAARLSPPTQVPPAASTPASSCIEAGGYGGLGARVTAFDPNNDDSTGPAAPSPGTAFYVVTAIARGCVTAFAVQDGTTPPLTARGLLTLVSRPLLPADAKQIVSADSCAVRKSRALLRATGREYARATAIAQAGSIPGTAKIAATSSSAC
jgi:hypothetical protein